MEKTQGVDTPNTPPESGQTWPDGYVPREELKKAVEQRQSLKKRADEAEARLAQLDKEANDRALAELEKGKQFDTAKVQLQKENEEARKKALEFQTKYQQKLIETHIQNAIAQADVYPEIKFYIQGLFKVGENDAVESLDGRSAEEIIKAKAAELPHLKRASVSGNGSGANGGHTPPQKTNLETAKANLSDVMERVRKNPRNDHNQRLLAEANVALQKAQAEAAEKR